MLHYNQEHTSLHIDTLDEDVALRVARLVVECSAPIDLAIAAVCDAQTYDDVVEHIDSNEVFLRRLFFH